MKLLLIIFSTILPSSLLFGQSSEYNKFTVRSIVLFNGFDYSLNKNSAIGLIDGSLLGNINGNNVETSKTNEIGCYYLYAFNCAYCDTYVVSGSLSSVSIENTTKDSSTYAV